MTDNFIHALWLGKADLQAVRRRLLRLMKRYPVLTEREGVISAGVRVGECYVPSYELGIASDNLICVQVGHQREDFPRWHDPTKLNLLEEALYEVDKLKPDKLIKGDHNCYVNCPECCDRPAYDNFLVRKYCEYLTEVGNYCLYELLGKRTSKPAICREYWCSSLREPYSLRVDDGPWGIRPRLYGIKSYTRRQKRALFKALETPGPVEEAAKLFDRYWEVRLFRCARRAILEIAKECGIKLNFLDRHEDFEAAKRLFLRQGIYERTKRHFDDLRRWELIYTRRKGIPLPEWQM